ncbi:HD domain-containing protein [bacterium]|nr:HD domain-containing protein [bacterium]MBU1025240.1 HD domain-containing protein [bacterium]
MKLGIPICDIVDAISSGTVFNKKLVAAILGTYDARSQFTIGRTFRVISWVREIGCRMNLSDFEMKELEIAALFNDIGMWGMPSTILNKLDRLNGAEYKIIKQHPILSLKTLAEFNFSKNIRDYILHHHESYDGSGYPDGLKGDEIPPGAQIIGVACALFSLTSIRAYREPVSAQKAIEIIASETKQFRPDLIELLQDAQNDMGIMKVIDKEVVNPFEEIHSDIDDFDIDDEEDQELAEMKTIDCH